MITPHSGAIVFKNSVVQAVADIGKTPKKLLWILSAMLVVGYLLPVDFIKGWIRVKKPLVTYQRRKPLCRQVGAVSIAATHQVDDSNRIEAIFEKEEENSTTPLERPLIPKKRIQSGSRCPGCGCVLQTTDKDSFGYVPEFVESKVQDATLCQRCFQLVHYGKLNERLIPPAISMEQVVEAENSTSLGTAQKLKTLFSSLARDKFLVLLVLDAFDLCGSLFSGIQYCLANAQLIICVNKIDLLPGVDCQTLVPYLKDMLQQKGLDNIQSIRFVSCKTGKGIQSLRRELFHVPRGKKVFVVGVANVGKSSILNELKLSNQDDIKKQSRRELNQKMKKAPKTLTETQLKDIEKSAEQVFLTTSVVPGTTLEVFPVKIGKGYKIYDTPGLFLKNHLSSLLRMEELKMVLPQKTVKPVSYRVEQGQCLFLGGLARFHFVEGKPFFVIVYTSSEVSVHLSSCSDSEKFLLSHVSKLLKPPLDKEWIHQVAMPWETSRICIAGKGWKQSAQDIAIAGLGWISLVGCGELKVECVVPHGIRWEVRDPLLPSVTSYYRPR